MGIRFLLKFPQNRQNLANFRRISNFTKIDKCIFISLFRSTSLYLSYYIFSRFSPFWPLPLSLLVSVPSRLISGLCHGFFCLVIKLRFPFFLSSMFPVISFIFGSQIFLTFIAVFILRLYFNK